MSIGPFKRSGGAGGQEKKAGTFSIGQTRASRHRAPASGRTCTPSNLADANQGASPFPSSTKHPSLAPRDPGFPVPQAIAPQERDHF